MSFAQMYGANLIPAFPQTPLATFTAAAASARVNPGQNANVRITVTGQALWIKCGDSTVTATAGTASEILVPVGTFDLNMGPTNTHLAYIQDAASAKGSIFCF